MNSMLHRVQCVTRRKHIPPVPVEAAPDEADCVMLRGYCMSQDEIGASEHAVPLQHDTLIERFSLDGRGLSERTG